MRCAPPKLSSSAATNASLVIAIEFSQVAGVRPLAL